MTAAALPPDRSSTLARLASESFDLLVVGGGIVGSGVARDAALRGLRVALVDQQDFAAGTSSRSTRLLHGGLRYLAQGEFGLVREASLEKKILHRIAPHLGQPLGFVFPAYAGEGPPLWQLRIGVKLYDLLCSGRNFEPSRGLSREEARAWVPGLKAEGLRGAVRYFDALTNDARLVIDTLRSAARHGAVLANHVRLTGATAGSDGWECQMTPTAPDEAPFKLRARTLVNATGPWADRLAHSSVKLRLTKGVHLVVDHRRLPVPDAVVVTEGKRILFVIPWGERVILGTTDTDYAGDPAAVTTEPADIAYVLRSVNEFFPQAELRAADIISTWAGLRPLVANPDGSPSDISRAHEIRSPRSGWWDITGGKLTTYRLMAEQAVDAVVRHLGRPPVPCRTAQEPLLEPGAGTDGSGILPGPCTPAAVAHHVRAEWACHLADVVVRRGGWCYYDRDFARRLTEVAAWMGAAAGWDAARREREIAACRAELAGQPSSQPGR